jgi:hypothetical protein
MRAPKVRAQRLADTRVLHLDRHLDDPATVVAPPRAVHLADRGRGERDVIEIRQSLPPGWPEGGAQVGHDDPSCGLGRHRRHRVGEPPQRRPVWRGHLLRHRRLEYRHSLPELRRPALELPKRAEQLVSGPGSNLVGGPRQPGSGGGGARGMPQWQRGQPGGTPDSPGREDQPFQDSSGAVRSRTVPSRTSQTLTAARSSLITNSPAGLPPSSSTGGKAAVLWTCPRSHGSSACLMSPPAGYPVEVRPASRASIFGQPSRWAATLPARVPPRFRRVVSPAGWYGCMPTPCPASW